jgi:ubiquinone/menaquinone biosynthesis C-methylase UbiE
MSWREFWNGEHAIYVNAKHKYVHNHVILKDQLSLIKQDDRVLDFGCGEAPLADDLTKICTLTLCDGAPSIIDKLKVNFTAILPEELASQPDATFDKIFVISVVQYLEKAELITRLADFKRLLTKNGVLYLADIIPHDVGIIEDTASLLKMAFRGGFLIAACIGLVKTALSPYRKLRQSFGLSKYDEMEMVSLLEAQGFKAMREARNIGPHPHRFTMRVSL